MPTYRFYNSKTKEEYTDLMTISEMEKFIKKKHIKLLQYMQELESLGQWVTLTKSQTAKARRLIKSALGESGECSIHSIDLSFRKCKHTTMQENDLDLPNNCSWVSASSINL